MRSRKHPTIIKPSQVVIKKAAADMNPAPTNDSKSEILLRIRS